MWNEFKSKNLPLGFNIWFYVVSLYDDAINIWHKIYIANHKGTNDDDNHDGALFVNKKYKCFAHISLARIATCKYVRWKGF